MLKVDPDDLQSINITLEVVHKALSKLKWGKSDGNTLSSDHLIFTPDSFVHLLAPPLFSSLLHQSAETKTTPAPSTIALLPWLHALARYVIELCILDLRMW